MEQPSVKIHVCVQRQFVSDIMLEESDPSTLFVQLDGVLSSIPQDFFKDPREFRSLVKVLEVLNNRVNLADNSAIDVSDLQLKLETVNNVIEKVVTFQHGGLNNSLDTMTDVVKEYSRGQEEIKSLRQALGETQKVLTAKKAGQVSLRELWTRRVELQESLKMVKELEDLKNVPSRVNRLIPQKRFFSSVTILNRAIEKMFSEELSNIGGLTPILQQIMELKERLLTDTIDSLKDSVLGAEGAIFLNFNAEIDSDEEIMSDTKSESAPSHYNGSTIYDESKSVLSYSKASMEPTSESFECNWSMDLQSFDESAESAAILDPNTSNNLYIRLLVKTIGLLQCEEDAERLLLDRFGNRFCDHYLKRQRSLIYKQVTKAMADSRGEESDLLLSGKLLGRYISYLLESVLAVVRRFCYVGKLLSVSKNQRGINGAETIFAEIVNLWNEMEDMVNYELRIHLVESEVEKISDQVKTDDSHSFIILDDDSSGNNEQKLLFPPSSRHAAIIFRRIVEYNATANNIIDDFFENEHRAKQQRPLLIFIQQFLESEFIPLIQSTVNQEIRDMTINVDLNFQHQKTAVEQESTLPCFAAQRTCLVAESLLIYYQELFQHRDMVVVVLDRLIRGFLAAGRDYKETLLFSWPFLNSFSLKNVLNSASTDPSFAIFRQTVCGGKSSMEECLGLYNADRSTTQSEASLSNLFANEVTSIWEEKYWNVGVPNYRKELNLFMPSETPIVAALSTILHGTDWLIRKLVGIIRRTSILTQSRTKDLSNKSSKTTPQRDENLRANMLSPLVDLCRFMDQILVVLRLLCQAHCFVFVSELARVTLNADQRNSIRKDFGGGDQGLSEESAINGFVQQLIAIVENIANYYSAYALPVVVGPVVVLLPRLLLQHIMRASRPADINPQTTSKLLRLVVTVQQHVSMFLQTALTNDLEAKRKLMDTLTEECERVRRYISKSENHDTS